jgi:predicted alpha/beta-fold hydrolase
MAFTYWPGACSITYTHHADPLILPSKTNGPSRALPELIKDSVPPCNLNPFLPNGHFQTAWTAMKFDGPPIHYKRRTFAASKDSYAGHFTVDFVTAPPPPAGDGVRDEEGNLAHDQGLTEDPVGIGHHYLPPRTTYFSDAEFEALGSDADDDEKPLLICLHGLSGGSYETYVRHVLAPLVEESPLGKKAGGLSGGEWEALVVNSRGCAGSRISNSFLYNARATWDVRQTVKWAREKWPRRRLFGVGFSLGANILTTVGDCISSFSASASLACSVVLGTCTCTGTGRATSFPVPLPYKSHGTISLFTR